MARYYIKEIVLFLLTLGLVYILKDAGITKYVVLLGISGGLFLYGHKNFKKEFLILGLPAFIYIAAGTLLSFIEGNLSYQSVKEISFAIIPLIAAISFFVAAQKACLNFIKWQYWSMIVLTLYWLRYYYVEDVLETQYAFIFGVFLLYFCVIKKNVKYVIFTTLMLYLMNKRIAMLAALLILVLYEGILYIAKKRPEWKKKILQCLVLSFVVLFLGYIVFLCVADLKGQFLQDVTSGRSSAWAVVRENYHLNVFWQGRGLGDVVNLLGVLQFPNFTTNLHNDLLKVFIEIGIVGYIAWLASHFAVCHLISKRIQLNFRKTCFLYLTMIYTLLVYTTDNIMVYVNYWFPAYLLLLMVVFSKEKEDIEGKSDQRLLLGAIVVVGICLLTNVTYAYMEYKNPSKFTIPEENSVEIYSPDGGTTRATVWLRDGQPYYRIRYGGVDLIEPSILGVEVNDTAVEKNVCFERIIVPKIVAEKSAVEDADNPIKTPYQSVGIKMEKDGMFVELEIRVYDYGVAFRYILPQKTYFWRDLTQIRFLHGSFLDIYDLDKNCEVENLSTEELENTRYGFPFLVEYANGSSIVISEEGVLKKGSYITKEKWKDRTLGVELSSERSVNEETVRTPWRVFQVSQ